MGKLVDRLCEIITDENEEWGVHRHYRVSGGVKSFYNPRRDLTITLRNGFFGHSLSTPFILTRPERARVKRAIFKLIAMREQRRSEEAAKRLEG